MALKGYTIHEIAHILFTARAGSVFRQWIIQNNLNTAFQVAEDSRIEYLMIGRFGTSVATWLNASVIRHLLNPDTQLEVQYPLYAGRTYVPLSIREALRSAFVDQTAVADIQRLVLEYREIVFDNQTAVDRAKGILLELDKLLKQSGIANLPDPFGHSQRPNDELETSGSRPIPYDQQERAKKQSQKRNEPLDTGKAPIGNDQTAYQPPQDTPQGCFPQPITQPGQPGQQGQPGQPGQQGQPGYEQGYEPGQPGFEPGQPGDQVEQGWQAGKGKQREQNEAIRELFQAELDKQYEMVKSEVRKEIRTLNRSTIELDTNGSVKPPRQARFSMKSVEQDVFASAKKFGQELIKIRTENEPGYEKLTDNGKLNAGRYLRECELDVAFDRFTNGQQEATDIEAVVLLDNSGSMSGNPANQAYRAMFAIKKGLQAINAQCSVITYNSYAETLYSADEKVSNQIKDAGASGGTNPETAVEFAYAVLANSNRAVKLLITITDGEWGTTPEVDEQIAELRESGVLTALAFISNGDKLRNDHNFEIVSEIKHTSHLLSLAKTIVKLAIGRKLTHA
jgi:Mg-chelatase subunit ChlD